MSFLKKLFGKKAELQGSNLAEQTQPEDSKPDQKTPFHYQSETDVLKPEKSVSNTTDAKHYDVFQTNPDETSMSKSNPIA